jgi:hypothetical protein
MILDTRKQAERDQAMAEALDFYASQWRGMFARLVEEGFTDTQALDLVKTYIGASCSPRGT